MDTPTQSQAPQFSDHPELRAQLLRAVLARSLSAHTLSTFYDTALEDLIALIEKAKLQYVRENPQTNLHGRVLDDAALGTDTQALLDEIIARKGLVESIHTSVQQTPLKPRLFVPPVATTKPIETGSGSGFDTKSIIPRVTALLYSLHNDLGIDYNDTERVRIERGIVHNDMVRNEPYYSVEVPHLHRLVLVCDEEENATFVFDTSQLRKLGMGVEQLKVEDKPYFRALAKRHPRAVRRIIYSPNWREEMLQALTEPLKQKQSRKTEAALTRSDFEPRVEVPKKKEGWESASSLTGTLRARRYTVVNYAETFRAEHPGWFEVQEISGNQTEHYHPNLVIQLTAHFTKVPSQKEGWKNASSLADDLHSAYPTILNYAESFRKDHPEWFEKQTRRGKQSEYYNPHLVNLLTEHFRGTPQKKDGWESAGSQVMIKVSHGNFPEIKKFVSAFRGSRPEWFEMQRSHAKISEYYHPDLVALLIEHFARIPRRKEGWESASSLIIGRGGDLNRVKAYAGTFKKSHPEWFEMQRNSARTTEYYHPDLVELIIKHLSKAPLKKIGWEHINAIHVMLQTPVETIRTYVESFRAEHPEWFERQKKRGRIIEHLHPDLVALVCAKFPKK